MAALHSGRHRADVGEGEPGRGGDGSTGGADAAVDVGRARDKVAAFTNALWCVPPDALPHATVGGVIRPFPDPLPIGLTPDGSWLFLYLVTTPLPTAFRTFLTRHVALWSALPSWRLRLLLPAAPHPRDQPAAPPRRRRR